MSQPPEEGSMTFMEHLAELRQRLLYSAIAVVVAMIGAFFFAEYLFYWLVQPLVVALPEGEKAIKYINPVEPFLVYLKLSFLAGLFIASPVVLYQAWRFVAPGLYPREKRAIVPFVLSGTLFFVGGALFCRYVVLPVGLLALMGVGSQAELFTAEPAITMREYFDVSTKLLLAFGLVFEMPVVVLFLSWIRLITYKTLLKHWRIAIVLSFLVAAILTPPDVGTQLMLAGPMIVLYFFSIGIAWVFGPRPSSS